MCVISNKLALVHITAWDGKGYKPISEPMLALFIDAHIREHVNKRAGCIISGAIRGTSSSVLFEESSWVSMETRRKHHRMYAFHKIVFNLSPPYLRNYIPSYVRDISSYQLRHADALRTIPCRLDLFYKSFFPLAVREWNLLPPELKTIQDHEKFKKALQKSLPVSNKLYSYGKRKCNIMHSRLRMGWASWMPIFIITM